MLNTRFRKILRDIAARKTRTFLVSMAIFIGVLGVVTLTSGGNIIVEQLKSDLRPDQLPMAAHSLTLPDETRTTPADNSAAFTALQAVPGLTDVEGRLVRETYWKKPGEESFIQGQIRAYSEPYGQIDIEPPTLIEGAFPVAGTNQVAIERRMADRYGLATGDQIIVRNLSDLETRFDPTAPIPEETWTISGIVFHPFNDNGYNSLYSTYPDIEYLIPVYGYTAFVARFTDYATAEANNEALGEQINIATPYTSEGTFTLDPDAHPFVEEVGQWSNTLTSLSVIAMLVSSFLVVTVISTIMAEQRRQIGVMKSLGATRWDNFMMYAGMALVYGFLGMIPGVLLGMPLGYLLADSVSPQVNILLDGFTISEIAVILGILMGLLVPVLAALIPVFNGTRVTILEAMTDLGIAGSYGQGIVADGINALPLPATTKQALANIWQKKGRLALTGFTLTLAAGAFMGVSAVFLSLDNTVDDIFETFNFEIMAFPQRVENYERARTVILDNVAGITTIEPSAFAFVEVVAAGGEGPELIEYNLRGFEIGGETLALHLIEGTGWQADPERPGVVITQSAAEELGKKLGDPLTVRYTYDQTVREMTLEIIGIDSYPFPTAFTHWETVAELTREEETDPIIPERLVIQMADRQASASEVEQKIGEIREVLLRNGIFTGFYNQAADEEQNTSLITIIGVIFNFASGVMAAIGAIGLLTTLSISVLERQREIGVMRSVGAGSGTVASQFLIEGLLVGMLSWIIGVPVSYLLGVALMGALPLPEFEFQYPLISLIAGMGGMAVLATVASLYPSLAAARKTVSDILRYQ